MSYCSVFLDDADVVSAKIDPTIITNALVNGDMTQGSWYTWAWDTVLYSYENEDGETVELTGETLNATISTDWNNRGDGKNMVFAPWTDTYPIINGDYSEHETIPGLKTYIDETKFKEMDLDEITYSMWIYVQHDNLAEQFFAFDLKYRAVNEDGTYGEYHTVSLKDQVTAGNQWVQVSTKLDAMTDECANAKTIEVEIFLKSYCCIFLDDAEVVAKKADPTIVKSSLVNGGFEQGSWYEDATLASETVSTDKVHSGTKAAQFMRDWASYPATGEYGESETIAGFNTTIKEDKFGSMDLSDMTLSMWVYADSDQFFAFNVKYRAVNEDGTYGEYHTASLKDQVTEYGTWVQVTATLDDMTAECANAKTIEFELYTMSYCSVFIDDVDVVATRVVATEDPEEPIEGDLDGDGLVNGSDLVLLRKYIFKFEDLTDLTYDVNGDGEVNILDLVILKKNCLV